MFILDSIPNARELGGYVLPGGAVIKRGLLLRGGALCNVSEDDATLLRDRYHLKKIFDFRTKTEVRKFPDKEIVGVGYFWMPAFNEENMKMEGMAFPEKAYSNLGVWLSSHAKEPEVQYMAKSLYTSMVTREFTQIQYAGFLQNIVNTTEGAVYWHCSQGKDRTGLGAAFILAALGADRELIMKDYSISAEYYRAELETYLGNVSTEEEKAVLQTFISVNCEYFENALDLIDSTWGSMKNFLTGPLCLGEDDMEILRNRYLE